MKKPNIVFFFTDDQRFDTIRALGNSQIITPNIDALVGRGTTFTHAHIPGGTCGAVCMPSRAMLNTGRTLFHLEDTGQEIPLEHELLGETLQRHGYHTHGIGKWHNGKRAFNRNFASGAEIYFGGMADHWNVQSHDYDPSCQYNNKLPICRDPFKGNEVTYRTCDHIRYGQHSTDLFSNAACSFINEYTQDNPFYLYVAFMAPHDPRIMPERFLKMYDDVEIDLPKNFMAGHPFDNGELHVRDEMLASFPRTASEIKQHLKEYYAMITHLDEAVGKVVQAVKDKGEFENTIFIFAGDNGLALGQHGLMGKQNMYNHSIRVPLIFAGPGIPENQKSDSLVYLLDIYPTLCEMLGIEKPASVDGMSLLETIKNPEQPAREFLYHAYIGMQRAVSNGKYKLIEYVVGGEHTETQFFDLINDPAELNNLCACEALQNTIAEFKAQMIKFNDEWDDAKHPRGEKFWNAYNPTNS